MQDEEIQRIIDETRIDTTLATMKDALYRIEELTQGNVSLYEILSFLTEDLVREGACAACLKEAVERAFTEAGANTEEHVQDGEAVYH